MKVIIHLTSGKKLRYRSTSIDPQGIWLSLLGNQDSAISFGRFVVPKSHIEYVEVFP